MVVDGIRKPGKHYGKAIEYTLVIFIEKMHYNLVYILNLNIYHYLTPFASFQLLFR